MRIEPHKALLHHHERATKGADTGDFANTLTDAVSAQQTGEDAAKQRVLHAHAVIEQKWNDDQWGPPSPLAPTDDNLAMAKHGINPAYAGRTAQEMRTLRFTYGKEAAAERIAAARQYRLLRWQALQPD